MFALLNILSGFLETGAVVFTLRSFGAEAALFSALLHQAGNLVPFPLKLSKSLTLLFSVVSALFMALGMVYPVCVVISTPFLSAAMQAVRSKRKDECGKMRKRAFRTLGFLLGFGFAPVCGILCVCVVFYCVIKNQSNGQTTGQTTIALPKFGTLQAIMLLHQMHYFVYCYAIMILAYQFGGALLASALFFAGWLTYVFAPLLYRNKADYGHMFLTGHSLLTALLILMFIVPSLPIKAFLWLLTGIGGTTEFCIGKLEKQQGLYCLENHNCAENFGHILGVMVCLVSFSLTGNLYLSILYSAAFAVCAAILMLTKGIKRRPRT